ncbi:unnamed protein product [Paramecium primaurelia]|uniref:Uncharacterized protein n=1 Tax=Paramecium primaurelia TaxID=5886 RepID=A0A8S1Q1T9_PARPR|nr:unnamed protein product [Paramecium primaurelia]
MLLTLYSNNQNLRNVFIQFLLLKVILNNIYLEYQLSFLIKIAFCQVELKTKSCQLKSIYLIDPQLHQFEQIQQKQLHQFDILSEDKVDRFVAVLAPLT